MARIERHSIRTTGISVQSINFGFLAKHDNVLLNLAALAERNVFDAPNTAWVRIRQLINESGVWFRDCRQGTNHPRALTGWYSPEGLMELLKQDIPNASAKLLQTSRDDLPLRYHPRKSQSRYESLEKEENRQISGERSER